MKTFEYRTDFENDPEGDRLTGELSAQFGLEHARRRRVYWAHWTAVSGLLLWFYALEGGSDHFRIVALSTFAAFFVGWVITIVAEIRCRLLHRS
jgi:hypothetical protein